jgi:hypothetical protein
MGLFVSVESGLIVGTLCHSIILVFYSSRHTAIFLRFRGFNKNNFFLPKIGPDSWISGIDCTDISRWQQNLLWESDMSSS